MYNDKVIEKEQLSKNRVTLNCTILLYNAITKGNTMEIGITEAIQHFFSNPSFELIYSEALANALDAGARNITISLSIKSFTEPETLEIIIKDDGEGFTDNNFNKFSELLKKSDGSHKGLGRLIYLKYFSKIEIESVYDRNKFRSFTFDNSFKGLSETKQLDAEEKSYSKLTFKIFSNQKLKAYENVNAISIKEYLLKNFLPRFFALKKNDETFCITIDTDVTDQNTEKGFISDTQTITENDLPELKEKVIKNESIDFFDDTFSILYNVEESYTKKISTAICVDQRAIEIPLLKAEKIPEKISGIFLLTSKFFDSRVDDSRQELILDNYQKTLIDDMFTEQISEILNDAYPEIEEENKKTSEKLSARYPHLEGYFSKKSVCLLDENKTLDDAQNKFFKEQKEILGASKLNDELYEKSFNHATRVLTEYILYRNIIIERLKNITGDEKEAKIHNLIVPMQQTLSAHNFINDIYSNNAWILDDKYMGYQTILSDENIKKLIEVISDDSEKAADDLRPDIALVFSDDIENSNHPVDVVIVELKRKGLDLIDNSVVITQLEQRARRLLGYYQNKIQRMFFFGIVEFDKELRIKLNEEWTPLYSGGESYYRTSNYYPIDKDMNQIGDKKYPVTFNLLSFDALWKDAKLRNETFLKILRDSILRYSENMPNK